MKLALLILINLLSISSYAQYPDARQNSMGEEIVNCFFDKHYIGLENKITQMKYDGITSRTFGIGFNAQGTIECGTGGEVKILKKYLYQPGPSLTYKINILSNGQARIFVNPIKLRLQNRERENDLLTVSFFSFTYDRNYTFLQEREFLLSFMTSKLSLDFMKRFNSRFRFEAETSLPIDLAKKSSDLVTEKAEHWDETYRANTRLSFIHSKFSIYVRADYRRTNYRGVWNQELKQRLASDRLDYENYIVEYKEAINQWEIEKELYEQQEYNGAVLDQEYYVEQSGNERPEFKSRLLYEGVYKQKVVQRQCRVSAGAEAKVYTFKNGQSLKVAAVCGLTLFNEFRGTPNVNPEYSRLRPDEIKNFGVKNADGMLTIKLTF